MGEKEQTDVGLCIHIEDSNSEGKYAIYDSFQELLTDDESENEAIELKKLFHSKVSSPLPTTGRHQLADSNKRLHFDSAQYEISNMPEKGEVQCNYSESLFSQNDALKNDLNQLSAQISCLALLSPNRKERKLDENDETEIQSSPLCSGCLTSSISSNRTVSYNEGVHSELSKNTTVSGEITCCTNTSERAPVIIPADTTVSENIICQTNACKVLMEQCKGHFPSKVVKNVRHSGNSCYTADESIVTISSAATTPLKSCSSFVSEDNEIIVLSDSDDDVYAGVSGINESGHVNLCTTLSNTVADRIEAFLNDIPGTDICSAENSFNTDFNESLEGSVEIDETTNEEVCPEDANEMKKGGKDKFLLFDQDEKGATEKCISSPSYPIKSCVEKINISATIKITVQISEPIIPYSGRCELNCTNNGMASDMDCNVATGSNTSKEGETLLTSNNCSYVDKVNMQGKLSPHEEPPNQQSPPSYQCVEKEVSKNASRLEEGIELHDKAKKLLDQLYGSAWQTPEVISTLDKMDKAEDTLNFTNFHQNINKDLESTTLKSVKEVCSKVVQKKNVLKKFNDRRNKKESEAVKTSPTMQITKTKCGRNVVQKLPKATKMFLTDEEVFPNDDSSTKRSSSSESDCSSYEANKKNKKKEEKDGLVYLDLSADMVRVQDVYESPAANNDKAFNERLQGFLQSYKYGDKPKLAITPNKSNIKRKLFTPRFGEENEEIEVPLMPVEDISALNDTDYVKMRVPLPVILTPLHKQFEGVKTGTPIFNTRKSPLHVKKLLRSREKNTDGSNKKKKSPVSKSINTKEGTPQVSHKKAEYFVPVQKEDNPPNKYGFLKSLDVMVSKSLCHPDALYYRVNFKTRKDELVQRLFELFNEKLFDNKLSAPIVWNKNLLNTAGRCRNKKMCNGQRCSTIELSEKVLTTPDRLRCTLIHELCHAATWIFNGENGHGATWKFWANKASIVFPELPKIKVCHQYDIQYKYTYKCTLCGAKSHAHSKSKKVENIRCAFCHGAIEIFLNKNDKDGNVIPTPVKKPSGFAKFVKENYKIYKKPALKHADVMKLLSNEFATLSFSEKNKYKV